ERALVDGDVAVLTELFWADGRCVRFGVADRQQGAEEIAAWRAEHPSVPAGRRLRDTRVLAVDDRTAVVTTLFDYPDGVAEGRPVRPLLDPGHRPLAERGHQLDAPVAGVEALDLRASRLGRLRLRRGLRGPVTAADGDAAPQGRAEAVVHRRRHRGPTRHVEV